MNVRIVSVGGATSPERPAEQETAEASPSQSEVIL